MIWRGLCLLTLCMCFGAFAGVPEIPRFRMLRVSDGLPSTNVTALARDQQGYLWIATWDGVARYDGVNFHLWRHDPEDPGSLPGNVVQALHIDSANRIWVATESAGLSVLGADRKSFTHYSKASHPQMGSDEVFAITSRGDETWFGTYGGGLHRISADGRISRFVHSETNPDSLPSDNIISLAFDSRGELWVGTMEGLARFDGKRMRRQDASEGPSGFIFSLSVDKDSMWVGTSEGVYQWLPQGGWKTPLWNPMFARPNALMMLLGDHSNEYWLASQRGLWRTQGQGAPVPVGRGEQQGRVLQSLLIQPDGGLWVPFPTAGLGYLRADWRRIAAFTPAQGLGGGLYRGLAESRRGGVWLSSSTGKVERLDTRSGEVLPLGRHEALFENLRMTSALEDSHGRLWLGYRPGLAQLDPDSGQLQQWSASPTTANATPDSGSVDWLRETPDGSLWLATQLGAIQRRDLVTGKVLETIDTTPVDGSPATELDAMVVAPDGALWIANGTGLQRWDEALRRFIVIDDVGSERIFSFVFAGPDHVWIHRLSGLESWWRHGDAWERERRIQGAEGLLAVESTGMSIDRHARLWLATRRGLFRIKPGSASSPPVIRNFGVRDGMVSQEFNDRGLLLTREGLLAGSTADGSVMLLDTEMEDPPVVRPNLVVDSVTVSHGDQLGHLPSAGGFELQPDTHEFQVSMRLLSFEDPLSNRYRSKLDGFDNGWVEQGSSGERVFSALSPGRYLLRMQGFDDAGNASVERTLAFRVLPPWWRSLWGITLLSMLALLLLLSLAAAYRSRVRRRTTWQLAEHKREVAEQASLAKTRFLATLGHEVRTPMTGVMGMSELLLATPLDDQQRNFTTAIQRAGAHLLRLVDDALDLARIEAGKLKLESQAFDLQSLLDEAISLTRPMAKKKALEFSAQLAYDLPAWVKGDPMRVRQILLNLLTNAIKFTERGQVSLHVSSLRSGVLRFQVSDTGPGINADQQSRLFRRFEQADGARTTARYGGSGLGLAICQELAIAMGGSISVSSTPGIGTRFNADLPLPAVDASPLRGENDGQQTVASLAILLVEDEPTVAEVIAGLLRARGHRVSHAAHGLAALGEVATARFDVAMLDLDLPGLDGLALARQLRLAGFHAPLLAITARADAEAEVQANEAGFDGFLRKPATGDMLAMALLALQRKR